MRNRKRNHSKKNKYELLLEKLNTSGILKEGNLYDITVLHDDDCSYENGSCDCHPVLRILDLTDFSASWDLSKLPKGLRAAEGDINIMPLRYSEYVD